MLRSTIAPRLAAKRAVASRQPAPAHGRAPARQLRLAVSSKLVLNPTGSRTLDHLIGDPALAQLVIPGPQPLEEGEFEVGRVSPAKVVLPIPTVSSRHAKIKVEGGKVQVIDLNSTNGTLVNGVELAPGTPVDLPLGAEVVFGDEYLCKFKLEEEAEAPPPPPPPPAAEEAAQ